MIDIDRRDAVISWNSSQSGAQVLALLIDSILTTSTAGSVPNIRAKRTILAGQFEGHPQHVGHTCPASVLRYPAGLKEGVRTRSAAVLPDRAGA
jgi:hypothetical protein